MHQSVVHVSFESVYSCSAVFKADAQRGVGESARGLRNSMHIQHSVCMTAMHVTRGACELPLSRLLPFCPGTCLFGFLLVPRAASSQSSHVVAMLHHAKLHACEGTRSLGTPPRRATPARARRLHSRLHEGGQAQGHRRPPGWETRLPVGPARFSQLLCQRPLPRLTPRTTTSHTSAASTGASSHIQSRERPRRALPRYGRRSGTVHVHAGYPWPPSQGRH